MKNIRKICLAVMVFCMLAGIFPEQALAAPKCRFSAKTSGQGRKIRVKKVTYDGEELEVKFGMKVLWDYEADVISVKDNKGKSYDGYLVDTDDDDCEIYIENLKFGRTYKIKIDGIRVRGRGEFQTLTLSVKIPEQKKGVAVKKVEYDEDFEYGRTEWKVSFEFSRDIRHKRKSYVIVKDAAGKQYSSKASRVEWDDDECEVHLNGALKIGEVYTYEIVNIKPVKEKKFLTVKGKFTAYY